MTSQMYGDSTAVSQRTSRFQKASIEFGMPTQEPAGRLIWPRAVGIPAEANGECSGVAGGPLGRRETPDPTAFLFGVSE